MIVQLLLVIVVIAVIATHVRNQRKEFFKDIQGTVGEDQNLMVTGKIMAGSGSHQLGKSRIPDDKGDVHLTPNGSQSSIFLNGKTILNNKLCFSAKNNDQQCFDANNISKKNNLCIDNECLNSTDINKVKKFDAVPIDWTGANFKRRDGRWTHFDWKDDSRNYIRGDTIQDGTLTVNGKVDVGITSITNDGCLRNGNRALCMQSDGNLVVYNSGRATWASGTSGR